MADRLTDAELDENEADLKSLVQRRIVCWFSAGAASAVATKLAIKQYGDVNVARINTGAEHVDNERFTADCERWFGQPVTILSSDKYADTWDVWERRRAIGFRRRSLHDRMAALERDIGHAVCAETIDGKKRPVWLDELDPQRGDIHTDPDMTCSLNCAIVEGDISA